MLAPCNGPCQTVDKSKLEFFKIGQAALLDSATDFWAPNLLIRNNLTWAIQIPDSLAPGNYVLRHEIIALHAANRLGGAQNYPFCFNLALSSSGTDKPRGQRGQGMYKSTDPGIYFDLIGRKDGTYPMPGPTLYSGAAKSVRQSGWTIVTATGSGVSGLGIAPTTTGMAAKSARAASQVTPTPPATDSVAGLSAGKGFVTVIAIPG